MLKYWIPYILIGLFFTTELFALPQKRRVSIEKLMTEGAFEKALGQINNVPSRYSNDPEVLLLKGICFYNLASFKGQAVEILTKALSVSNDDRVTTDILYHTAQAYMANDDYINAIKSYNRLQKVIPDYSYTLHQKIENDIAQCERYLEQYGLSPEARESTHTQDSVPAVIWPWDRQAGNVSNTPNKTSIDSTNLTNSNNSDHSNNLPQAITSNVGNQTNGTQYTIQICTMSFPLADSFFKGQYGVKLIKVGDLYRYIYSVYTSLPEAQQDLPKIRKIYPDAFIREFDENKLGKAIDLNLKN